MKTLRGGVAMKLTKAKQKEIMELIKKAKFWLYRGLVKRDEDEKFYKVWYWFIPVDSKVIVVKEWLNCGEGLYEVFEWSLDDFEDLLEECYNCDYAPKTKFYSYRKKIWVDGIGAVIDNWTEEELENVRRWWEAVRITTHWVPDYCEYSREVWRVYFDGIKKGYYLIPLFEKAFSDEEQFFGRKKRIKKIKKKTTC
jgi:hypothetical protein